MFSISFQTNIAVPKYRQIIDTVILLLKNGSLKKGDKLPSCNELCKQYGLSQDTVYMAYNELKSLGLIVSKVGKGYFVLNTNVDAKHNLFILFDQFTAFKEELYEAFKFEMKGDVNIQIFFHHNNLKVFKSLIEGALGEYSEFVIMPVFEKYGIEILDILPKKKVFLLDRAFPDLKRKYSYVCQEFENDIYQILNKNYTIFENYKRMVLVIRNSKNHFREIIKGFRAICKKYSIAREVIFDISTFQPKQGDAFIVVDDKDLVFIVKKAQELYLEIGPQVGIISYNETPLKQIVAGGITTISTDFAFMGKTMAELILSGKKQKVHNPFVMTKRSSTVF